MGSHIKDKNNLDFLADEFCSHDSGSKKRMTFRIGGNSLAKEAIGENQFEQANCIATSEKILDIRVALV